jgi:hypothetical protein
MAALCIQLVVQCAARPVRAAGRLLAVMNLAGLYACPVVCPMLSSMLAAEIHEWRWLF